MVKHRAPYPPEFRRPMVDLVRSGRGPEELAQELEPTAQVTCNCAHWADRDEGLRIMRRWREIVEWSGVPSETDKPRKFRKARESASLHAIPRSELISSK